ncbi:MAG: DUF1287 domain-containing protein [Oscillospiraceae bacterium]|nr:DUF1287 domain-containing protein [Oscillospiraceae bacterium]
MFFYERALTGADFGIETVKSSCDADDDGVDDYTDIMLGARLDAENMPRYDGSYHAGGYPPDDIGVCTDVVWRAFKNAGYDLKQMVDNDIARCPQDYPGASPADPNIDFRRVSNLDVFFSKYAQSLTTNVNDISQWQPGDIAVFENDSHIGIVSDLRNSEGVAFLIHNSGQRDREEDRLSRSGAAVIAHYRFDASQIGQSHLVLWSE